MFGVRSDEGLKSIEGVEGWEFGSVYDVVEVVVEVSIGLSVQVSIGGPATCGGRPAAGGVELVCRILRRKEMSILCRLVCGCLLLCSSSWEVAFFARSCAAFRLFCAVSVLFASKFL